MGDAAQPVMPTSVKVFAAKKVFFKSAKSEGFQVRRLKLGEDASFVDNIAICVLSIDRYVKGLCQYARFAAFKVEDSSTLWIYTIPSPVWEKGENITSELLTSGKAIWEVKTEISGTHCCGHN
ncbi:MAG: hypothetical protein RMK89_11975 [Armatimonadota bacterium]|nr:hypothetical protein [Armatimonadota bacterium]MDW8144167.1 hypothetical protein [Armatimonadota bacterium]